MEAERQGAFFLYIGVLGFIRNPTAHRDVRWDPVDAAQVIGFVDLLLKWIHGGLAHTRLAPQQIEALGVTCIADVDGDGMREVITVESSPYYDKDGTVGREGKIIVQKNGETVAVANLDKIPGIYQAWWISVSDLDNDGCAEIIVRERAGASTMVIWVCVCRTICLRSAQSTS